MAQITVNLGEFNNAKIDENMVFMIIEFNRSDYNHCLVYGEGDGTVKTQRTTSWTQLTETEYFTMYDNNYAVGLRAKVKGRYMVMNADYSDFYFVDANVGDIVTNKGSYSTSGRPQVTLVVKVD